MTRQTSLEAYERIKREGLLSKMRLAVYGCLYEHGPLTASEVDERLVEPGKRPHASKRLTELEALGVAVRVEVRACRVTGNRAQAWDVNADLPSTPEERAGWAANEASRLEFERQSAVARELLGRGESVTPEKLLAGAPPRTPAPTTPEVRPRKPRKATPTPETPALVAPPSTTLRSPLKVP